MPQKIHKTPHKYKLKNLSNSHQRVHSRKKVSTDKLSLVYICILPKCSHYLPNIELAEGKETLCHGCNEPMIITQYDITHKTVKPVCSDCKEFKKRKRLLEQEEMRLVKT